MKKQAAKRESDRKRHLDFDLNREFLRRLDVSLSKRIVFKSSELEQQLHALTHPKVVVPKDCLYWSSVYRYREKLHFIGQRFLQTLINVG